MSQPSNMAPPDMARRRWLGAAALSPLLGACATDLDREANAPLPDLAARLGVCAASHAVLRAGRPQPAVLTVGCASGPPDTPAPIFQAASLTKPLTAYVVLQLVRSGSLDLRAPVSRYLPHGYRHRQRPFAGPADARADLVPPETLAGMPLATLLNHSAGLPNWTGGVLAPAFTPGKRWQYSGEGYLLLQVVIEAATNMTFEAAAKTLAFSPLNMHDTRLRLTDDIRGRVVDGTGALGQRAGRALIEANAAASLYTTAADYAHLLAAWVDTPPLMALALSMPVALDAALGLGWGIEAADGGPYLWQWGNNPGFRAFTMLSVASGDGFVLLTNSERGMPLAAALARQVLPARHGVFRSRLLG